MMMRLQGEAKYESAESVRILMYMYIYIYLQAAASATDLQDPRNGCFDACSLLFFFARCLTWDEFKLPFGCLW